MYGAWATRLAARMTSSTMAGAPGGVIARPSRVSPACSVGPLPWPARPSSRSSLRTWASLGAPGEMTDSSSETSRAGGGSGATFGFFGSGFGGAALGVGPGSLTPATVIVVSVRGGGLVWFGVIRLTSVCCLRVVSSLAHADRASVVASSGRTRRRTSICCLRSAPVMPRLHVRSTRGRLERGAVERLDLLLVGGRGRAGQVGPLRRDLGPGAGIALELQVAEALRARAREEPRGQRVRPVRLGQRRVHCPELVGEAPAQRPDRDAEDRRVGGAVPRPRHAR